MTTTALIVAAGSGSRMGGSVPKQFRALAGKPVLRWAVEALLHHPAVKQVRVVVGAGQIDQAVKSLGGLPVGDLIEGGSERADSVRAGLSRLTGDAVLVHDAARPFCPADVVDRLIARLEFFEGAAPVLPINDTLARAGETLGEGVDRSGLARIQTPQAFRLDVLKAAYDRWSGPSPTDETTVVRAAGGRIATVEGDPLLEKLTLASDFERAEQRLLGSLSPRTGLGFDVHGFSGEGPIMLGGIEIAHPRGLAGHSDADVVLHAITDALLGAAGFGDIGEHFPPSNAQWKGAASALFLRHAADLLRAKGALIDHIDCTVIAEEPKIAPHRSAMRAKIAEIAGLRVEQVSVKATTTEGLGFAGRTKESPHRRSQASGWDCDLVAENLLPTQLVDKAREVVEANRKVGRRVAVAESCTGGLVSAALTEIPGSSEMFEAGYVTYSNAAKIAELKVSEEVVDTFGAVSVATAWAMARGALSASDADVAVAITGIAGPGGGTPNKPVGTVVFARAERDADPAKIVADQKFFDETTRSGVRLQAALCALDLLMP